MNKEKEKPKEILEASDLTRKYTILEQALDEGFKGLILKVMPVNSRDFFGTQTFEDRPGYAIEVKLNSDKGEIFEQFFSLPDSPQGLIQSNMYKFKQKYESIPKKGLEVDVILNEDGFFEIVF
ncbi:unnamed protein product [marine sediment metagenome]|uniref:Uncharacterized protein n=1 Tax=marine sediment metagenome TaxID=412755 RepID=X1CBR6_9ZZZZ